MSSWQHKAKSSSKAAFDAGWAAFEKLGAPVNKVTNKIGSEAFWPTSLGPECDKAARVLKSFCKDGFYTEEPVDPNVKPTGPGPKHKPKVLVKIPQKAIQKCVGLAIFTVMRTGLWVSGAGGSGVLIARKEDGTWSPPSGILIHTLGVGFMAGIDIYDCVCVINDRTALAAFTKLRVSLGGEVSVVAGPLGVGGNLETDVLKNRKPVWSYMKSRGLYGGLQIDGTIIVERNDENANFYGERVPVAEILKGNVKRVPKETRMLMEVVKQAEGRTDLDQGVLHHVDTLPPPGDVEVESMSKPTQEQEDLYAPPSPYAKPQQHQEFPPQQPPRPGQAGGAYASTMSGGLPAGQSQEPYYPPPPPGGPPHQAGQQPYYPPPPTVTPPSYQQGQAPYFPPPPGPPPAQEGSSSYPQELASGQPPAYQAPSGAPPVTDQKTRYQ